MTRENLARGETGRFCGTGERQVAWQTVPSLISRVELQCYFPLCDFAFGFLGVRCLTARMDCYGDACVETTGRAMRLSIAENRRQLIFQDVFFEVIANSHQNNLKTAIYLPSNRAITAARAPAARAAAAQPLTSRRGAGASPGRDGEPLPKRSIDFRYLCKTFILTISFVLGNIPAEVHTLGRRAMSHPRIEALACVKRSEIFSILGQIKTASLVTYFVSDIRIKLFCGTEKKSASSRANYELLIFFSLFLFFLLSFSPELETE